MIRPWALPKTESPRIRQLRESGDEASFLRELEQNGTPLIEASDTPGFALFTFVWHGDAPHGVLLHAVGVTDQLDPADTLLEHIPGTKIHALSLIMPDTWQCGYLFLSLPGEAPGASLHKPVDLNTLVGMMRVVEQDPFARDTIPNKLGARTGSNARHCVARGSNAPSLSLWRSEPVATAECEELIGPGSRSPLPVRRWPHADATETSPVIVLMDGEVWREQFPIVPQLIERIERETLPAVHVVFVESPDPRQRSLDLATQQEAMGLMLAGLRARISPLSVPMIVAGQSLGGLFALHAVSRFPQLVSVGVAQSPSVWWPNMAPTEPRRPDWFAEQDSTGGSPAVVQYGALEWVLRDRARDAAALLRAQDRLIDEHEFMGGHDVLVWQSLLPDALEQAVRSL